MLKITRWGNSLGIRIPKNIVEQIKLAEGDELEVSTEAGKLVLTPKLKKQYSLDELLEGMDEKHLHAEIDWGNPQGSELW